MTSVFESRLGQCDFIDPELDIAQPEDSFRAGEGSVVGRQRLRSSICTPGTALSLLVPNDSLQRHDVGRTMFRNLAIGCGLRVGLLRPGSDKYRQRKQAEKQRAHRKREMRCGNLDHRNTCQHRPVSTRRHHPKESYVLSYHSDSSHATELRTVTSVCHWYRHSKPKPPADLLNSPDEGVRTMSQAATAVEGERVGRCGDPCAMVIFGAAGDLTRRKLIPSLYNLAKYNLLSREFAMIGVARNPMTTDEFRAKLAGGPEGICR